MYGTRPYGILPKCRNRNHQMKYPRFSTRIASFRFPNCLAPVLRSPVDFDGDGLTDLSIFRSTPGEWWWLRSTNGTNGATQFGI